MLQNYDSICCFRSNENSMKRRVCWEIITDCNLNCPFCHRYKEKIDKYDVEKLQETMKLLKKNRIKNVIISGGEPLLHENLFTIMDDLSKNGFELDLCTNATLLNDKLIYKLKKYVTEISVSIDGFNEKRHDKFRATEGSFCLTVKNIKKLIAEGFEVHSTTVVDSSFADNIIEMVEYLNFLGIKSMAFLGLIPIETGKNELFNKECQEKLKQQISLARKKFPDININTKQLLVNESLCSCSAGDIVWGMGVDGMKLERCLLLRNREGHTHNNDGIGMCPGSKYLNKRSDKLC